MCAPAVGQVTLVKYEDSCQVMRMNLIICNKTMSLPEISGYHAHVYFDAATLDQATLLCEQATEKFSLQMGRIHKRPVGPHPCWSCQLAFPSELFGELIPWLVLHRNELTVFVHPLTGNHLADHTQHVIWLGESMALDVSAFL